jgi:hypothetical protein
MVPQVAVDQYQAQQSVSATTTAALRKLWGRLGPDFSSDWYTYAPYAVNVLTKGIQATVTTALPYIGDVLDETGQRAPGLGELNPLRLSFTLADGRTAAEFVGDGLITLKSDIKAGMSPQAALRDVEFRLTSASLTALADKRREVYGADMMQRPQVTGYVRALTAPSCSRCVILAGKWSRQSKAFQRHPRCDCIQVPAAQDDTELFTDPHQYFHSLSPAQQAKTFGKDTAQAIHDGADIYKVVNLKGVSVVNSGYRSRSVGRVTVADIYRTARTRDEAVQLLKNAGYLQPGTF